VSEAALLAFLKQRKELYPQARLSGFHDLAGYTETPAFRGLLSRLVFAVSALADKSFSEKYKVRFGADPVLSASSSYDIVRILIAALRSGSGSVADVTAYLRASWHETVTFGAVSFNALGGISESRYTIESFD